ncbi:hypothetical protein [Citrobacter sp. VF227]
MKPSYEELEEQLDRSRRLCDAALANERVWEIAMMKACGEDGPKSVAEKFSALEQKLTDMAVQLANAESKCRELAAEENNLIDSECHVAELEESLRDKQALLEALDNSLCELLPGTQYMDPPDGGSVTPLEQVRRMVADYRNQIAELEERSFNPAILDVIAERQRQQSVEGWTPEHDNAYQNSELADAAACYAIHAHNQGFSTPAHWPWSPDWWKQSGARRDLIKAGALILAEIERIDRAAGIGVKGE